MPAPTGQVGEAQGSFLEEPTPGENGDSHPGTEESGGAQTESLSGRHRSESAHFSVGARYLHVPATETEAGQGDSQEPEAEASSA